MKYTFIENMNKKDFEKFVEHHNSKSHFMQSYYFGEISRFKGFEPYQVGMKKDGSIVATALLLKKTLFKDI